MEKILSAGFTGVTFIFSSINQNLRWKKMFSDSEQGYWKPGGKNIPGPDNINVPFENLSLSF